MFGILSLILALPALFLVSGVLDLPPFYGMTAGLVACTAAVVELMGGGEEVRPIGKRAAFFGLVARRPRA
mgnify:CR=1 FL=1